MKYSGNNVSPGYAVGTAYVYEPFRPIVPDGKVAAQEPAEAAAHYQKAKQLAQCELQEIIDRLSGEKDEKAKIFTAHLDILFDEVMDEDILRMIGEQKASAETAVSRVYETYAKELEGLGDELIRERAADLRDVKNRLLRCLSGAPERNLSSLAGPVIILARNLLPSDTATIDRKNVLAIVTETGGETSHSAIIAKSYGIPAILGISDVLSSVKHGDPVIVDAVKGNFYTKPTGEQIEYFTKKRDEYAANAREIKKCLTQQPVMKDGKRIGIFMNIGSGKNEELESEPYVDGIGLFRTEFLYLEKEQPPTEEEQFEIYRKVLSRFGDKPVVLRTLDIGGDKTVSYLNLPKEDNPFLGNRALRFCLSRCDIFKTQLRAAFRASVYGNLWIMFPMVGTLDDIRNAKAAVEEVKAELRAEEKAFSGNVKIGIMIEIPSIAILADKAAKEVDFASIGTNDLCQYTLAVDRMNPSITQYYQSYHPSLFRLIGYVAEEFRKEGKTVSVCGELGGDRLAPAVLIGLGISKLSMSLSSVARTKMLISKLTMERAQEIAETVKNLGTAGEVSDYLQGALKDAVQ